MELFLGLLLEVVVPRVCEAIFSAFDDSVTDWDRWQEKLTTVCFGTLMEVYFGADCLDKYGSENNSIVEKGFLHYKGSIKYVQLSAQYFDKTLKQTLA